MINGIETVRYLYKYVTADTGRKILETGKLRWSTPAVLNDPFDMQFAYQLPPDRAAVRAKTLQKLYRQMQGDWEEKPLDAIGIITRSAHKVLKPMTIDALEAEMGSSIDQSIGDIYDGRQEFNKNLILDAFAHSKILCLSEIPDSILMWAYYAQNHSGLVLRFRDDAHDNPLKQAKPIRYVAQMPPMHDEESLSDLLAGYGNLTVERIRDDVVWTKSEHWKHEQEWRIYAGDGRLSDAPYDAPYEDIRFGAEELDGVVFGLRTPAETLDEIRGLVSAAYPHVELLKARQRPDAYALDMIPLGCPEGETHASNLDNKQPRARQMRPTVKGMRHILVEQIRQIDLCLHLLSLRQQGKHEFSCGDDHVLITIATMIHMVGISGHSVLKLTEEVSLQSRDAYPLARAIIEGVVNIAFIMAKGAGLADRARRHAEVKSYLDMRRQWKVGQWGIKVGSTAELAEADKARLEAMVPEFRSANGHEKAWTPENLTQRLEAIERAFPSSAMISLNAAAFGIYRHSSEVLHGTLFSAIHFWGMTTAGAERPKTADEMQLILMDHQFAVLTSVIFAFAGLVECFGNYVGDDRLVKLVDRPLTLLTQLPAVNDAMRDDASG
jgi:hypothetical protein